MPLFFCMVTNAVVAYSGGSGTPESPYQISVANDIYLLSHSPSTWSNNFILTNDLDLTSFAFQPIANMTNKFNGVFDGNGRTINGLIISGTTYANPGFFGAMGENAVVKNLTLTNANVSVTYTSWLNAGIVAGYNSGSIINCNINGKINASASTAYAGAAAGYNHITGYIADCTVSASVSTSYCGGGIAGYNAGDIAGSTMTGNVIAGTSAGATGAYAYSGGIAGLCKQLSTITDCGNTAVISASINEPAKPSTVWAGGITAYSEQNAAITGCFSSADVAASVTGKPANAYSGGIVGKNDRAIISECYATGAVSAQSTASSDSSASYAGGLFGSNYGATTNCYSIASVNANAAGSPNSAYAGGISGWQSTSAVSNCYSTGVVTSNTGSYKGAFAGRLTSGSIAGSFWDTEASGITTPSIGSFAGGTYTITGKTTAQMKTQATFTGWNFSQIWEMSEPSSQFAGYPIFVWQTTTLVTETINLVAGWTWISFNVLPSDASVGNVFANYPAVNNDIIVASNGANTTYFNGSWLGTLTTIEAGKMYKIRRATAGSFDVTGRYVDASAAIQLVSGWSWLGYTLPSATNLSAALTGMTLTNNDIITSQTGQNATYWGGVWYGSLTTLEPGKGYMIKLAIAQTFAYPLP